jgi:hypothetical protein
MKQELDDALCRDFPNLYKERTLSMQETCMYWGFPGDGWEPLIRRLSEKLEPLGVVATQVKEKFGTLRFYFSAPAGAYEEAAQYVQEAEAASAATCENCGAFGELGGQGWLTTQCESCRSTRVELVDEDK